MNKRKIILFSITIKANKQNNSTFAHLKV